MGMEYNAAFIFLIGIFLFGCAQNAAMEKNEAMAEKDVSMQKEDSMTEKNDEMTEDGNAMEEKNSSMMASSFSGKVLAGTTSPYIEFNKADYEKALSENKKILLYFYASWCPSCKKEQPELFAAFGQLNDPDIVGFRVDYNDNEDADEKALARQFGVAYQHTKVILKDGKQVAKFPDSWSKQRYLDELMKV